MHVRFGPLADIAGCLIDVRFTPESGHRLSALGCPLSANKGHRSHWFTNSRSGHLKRVVPESLLGTIELGPEVKANNRSICQTSFHLDPEELRLASPYKFK
jgi:hypothetical protein